MVQGPVSALQRGCQPPLHIQHHPRIGAACLNRLDHQVPRHAVEKRLNIKIDDPVGLPTTLTACLHRVQGRPMRPVPIGIRMEDRFDLRLQPTGRHRLGDPVRNTRNPKHPNPIALRFRYLHRLHRGRKVTARGHPVPDLVKIVLQVPLEVLQPHPIHTRRTLVGFHLPIGLPHLPLGNVVRLSQRLQFLHRFLPRTSVDQTDKTTDDPAPSLHPHRARQELHRYYEPVRQRIPDRYSRPHGFSPLGTLPPAIANNHDGSTGTRLPTFHARAAEQAHVAYMPDTTRPTNGHPPD